MFFTTRNIVHCVAITTFPWWRNAERLRPVNIREMIRSETRFSSRSLFCKRLHYFFRGDWNFINPHSDSVVHGVGDRGHDRQERALTDFLRSKRAARVWLLNQLGDYIGHVEGRRALVFEDGREFVHERMGKLLRQAAEFLLFHQSLAETHIHAAFYPAPNVRRIQPPADSIGSP